MDVEKFRKRFPEFADPEAYPRGPIDFWVELAEELIGARAWGKKREAGMFLFVAHNLVLARQNAIATKAGGTPGAVIGTVTSETAGDLSVSYSKAEVSNPKAGVWNLTTYGQQYAQLVRMVGQGVVQL